MSSAGPLLPADEVLVIWAEVGELLAGSSCVPAAEIVSQAEAARASHYKRSDDKARSRAGAALLRLCAGAVTGTEPRVVEVSRTCVTCGARDHGRPSLPGTGVEVSLSHSGSAVCVALFAGSSVGVDVESRDAVTDADVLRLMFDCADPAGTAATPAEARAIWTRKEAVLKATGEGLMTEPSCVWVSRASEPAALVAHRTRPGLECTLHDLAGRYGCTGALAVLQEHVPAPREIGLDELMAWGR